MKWIGERISFVDNKDKLTIVIYPPEIGIKYQLVVFWSLLWLAIGAYVTSQFFYVTNQKEQITLIIFMSFSKLYFYLSDLYDLTFKKFVLHSRLLVRIDRAIRDSAGLRSKSTTRRRAVRNQGHTSS